ncbi:MAG: DUF3750 domain-containing protein [Alphaproteobacteria bacterium]|nr:MAG: DUF3750 domain-containing protein [Alphaproteobacteria bacterium]
MKIALKTLILIFCVVTPFLLPQMLSFAAGLGSHEGTSWSTARHGPSGLSPAPNAYPGAIIQVFGARTWSWRGYFAIHSWISMKAVNADHYDRYEVIGWRAYHGSDALSHRTDAPDNYWFGSRPQILAELRGEEAGKLIGRIKKVIAAYPYRETYTLWPGPNSNSFTAYVGRQVPELKLDLPPTAIGKDFIAGGALTGPAVSGSGFQFSMEGYGGFSVGPVEGAELHLLGLTLGFDFGDLAVKLPGFGRIPLL